MGCNEENSVLLLHKCPQVPLFLVVPGGSHSACKMAFNGTSLLAFKNACIITPFTQWANSSLDSGVPLSCSLQHSNNWSMTLQLAVTFTECTRALTIQRAGLGTFSGVVAVSIPARCGKSVYWWCVAICNFLTNWNSSVFHQKGSHSPWIELYAY